MRERHFKTAMIFGCLSFVLLQYQNCGSQSQQENSKPTTVVQDPDMGVINPVNTGSIQFLQSKTEIDEETQNIAAYGVCSSEQQGALLSWKLVDENALIVSKGRSTCDRGAFEIVSSDVAALDCGSLSKLTAYLGSSEKTELIVEKKCQ